MLRKNHRRRALARQLACRCVDLDDRIEELLPGPAHSRNFFRRHGESRSVAREAAQLSRTRWSPIRLRNLQCLSLAAAPTLQAGRKTGFFANLKGARHLARTQPSENLTLPRCMTMTGPPTFPDESLSATATPKRHGLHTNSPIIAGQCTRNRLLLVADSSVWHRPQLPTKHSYPVETTIRVRSTTLPAASYSAVFPFPLI